MGNVVILPPRSAGRFLALCEARKAGGIRIHPPPLPHFAVFRHAVVINGLSLLIYAFHVLSFLPVQPVGQLLNIHFQSVVFCSSFNQILIEMLSAVGCVNS